LEEKGENGEDVGDVPLDEPLIPHLAKGHGVFVRGGCIALELSEPVEAQDADCETEKPDDI
jgi:hypothetical protein